MYNYVIMYYDLNGIKDNATNFDIHIIRLVKQFLND